MKEFKAKLKEVMGWVNLFSGFVLIAVLAVALLKMFGINPPFMRVSLPGYQELGVFAAGAAFAMSKL